MLSSPQLTSLKDKGYQTVLFCPQEYLVSWFFPAVITVIQILFTDLWGKGVCVWWNTFIYKFSTLQGEFQEEELLEKLRRVE